jgi:Protein of unknown function (DUF4232)
VTAARRTRALFAGVMVLAALTACRASTPGNGTASSAPPDSSSVQPPASSLPDSVPTSSEPGTPTSSPSSPAASSSSAAPRSSCTQITIRVIRGSASPGAEFAALQFVNAGSQACTLVGYPAVTLVLNGKTVGRPSQPASTADSRIELKPGDTAESKLNDFSGCQAPLSDNVRVVAPGSTISAVRPAQLRACTLRVSALAVPE